MNNIKIENQPFSSTHYYAGEYIENTPTTATAYSFTLTKMDEGAEVTFIDSKPKNVTKVKREIKAYFMSK